MCFNSSSSSSSSSSSDVFDERIGADNGSVAVREITGGDVTFQDLDADVAQFAIDSSLRTLQASTDFLNETFTQVLNNSEKSVELANTNVAATRDFAASLIDKEQESSDDRLIKVLMYGSAAVVAVYAIQSGAIKDITGAFK
jgi:hypothetical protein